MSSQVDNTSFARFYGWSASSFVTYEWLITASEEIQMFWHKPFSAAAALFYVNRYMVMRSCKKASQAIQILALSQYLAWGAFSALRSYALKRNKVISLFVFGLHVVFFAIRVGTVLLSDAQAVINPGTTCLITRSNAPEQPLVLLSLVSQACLILANVITMVITWNALFRQRVLRGILNMKTFADVLLHDGTAYFAIMLYIDVMHIVSTFHSYPTVARAQDAAVENVDYTVGYTEPITTVLTSRFLLHLQSVHQKTIQGGLSGTLSTPAGEESLVFARVIGSLGALSQPDEHPESDDPPNMVNGPEDMDAEHISSEAKTTGLDTQADTEV